MEYNVQLFVNGDDGGYYHVKGLDDWDVLEAIQAKVKPGEVEASIGRYGDDVRLGTYKKDIKSDWDGLLFREGLRAYLMVATLGTKILEGNDHIISNIGPAMRDEIKEWAYSRQQEEDQIAEMIDQPADPVLEPMMSKLK